MSISSKIVNRYLKLTNRQKKFSDPEYFREHLRSLENAPRYELPSSWDFGVQTERIEVCGYDCYVLNRGSDRAILYIHGGSGIHEMMKYHYRFIKKILKNEDVTVYLPIYPLAPVHKFGETYEMMDELWDIILSDHHSHRVTVMGDSMGGNIALSFVQSLIGKSDMPGSLILLSPWLDMTMEHPDTLEYYKKEPRLALHELHICGDVWAGGTDKHDPRLSPIYGPLKGIPHICLCVGTEEILLLDAERLDRRMDEEGIDHTTIIGEGLSHVYPIQPVKEARAVFPVLMKELAR